MSPFLAPRALWALALMAPLLTVVTAPLSGSPSFAHWLGCLAGQWVPVMAIGAAIHALVALSRPQGMRLAAVVALAYAIVFVGLLLALPPMAALGHRIDAHLATFVVAGAVGLAAVYLVGARGAAVLQARLERSRLDALQAQLNPHFLFNGLNSVASLIPDEPALAESMVERLSGVLQYSLAASRRPTVKLSEELDVVRDYLGVEHTRFGRRLRSKIEVGDELLDQPIPPMLLQPLVENAVLHGLAGREEGGEVCVTGRVDGDQVVLVVWDDGVGPGGSKRRGNGVGLSSVRERLALTFGGTAAFEAGARDGGGFRCELRLPRARPA